MPEGDTIYRTADTLRKVLVDRTLTLLRVADSSDPTENVEEREGTVSRVVTRGKHLLVEFADDRVLHTHMMMTGSWHVYRHGETWRRASFRACVELHTSDFVAVCFDAPLVRFGTRERIESDHRLTSLGPDLLDREFDETDVLRRMRADASRQIGEALMLQRIAAGIGNVYKSEALFLARCDPFTRLRDLDDVAVLQVIREARRLMLANREGYPRVTRRRRRGEYLWVYRRAGRPCAKCSTLVRMRRQGEYGHSTYFCPRCQRQPDPIAE